MPPTIKPGLTVQDVGEESLVLDLKSGQIHQLNTTAAWILSQCNGENSAEAIASEFAEMFSLDDETALRDVNTTIDQLHKIDIVTIE